MKTYFLSAEKFQNNKYFWAKHFWGEILIFLGNFDFCTFYTKNKVIHHKITRKNSLFFEFNRGTATGISKMTKTRLF